jgi:hypothetical protein
VQSNLPLPRRPPGRRRAHGRSPRDRALRAIAAHFDFLLSSLHNHHSGENENIWPRLLERAAPYVELITGMEKQHHVVAERSERVRILSETWRQP